MNIVKGLLCAGVFARSYAFGQAGIVDPAFNPQLGPDGPVYAMAVQHDGKVLIVGGFTNVNGIFRNRIARLNSDGTVDGSFDPGTGANEIVFNVDVRAGKIVVGGFFTSLNGSDAPQVGRLNLDGSVDASFFGGAFHESLRLTSNGQVILGGAGYRGFGEVVRLQSSGAPDLSFQVNVDRLGAVYALALQPDEKIFIGGTFLSVNDQPRFRIARLNTDGELDPTFLPEGGSRNEVAAIAVHRAGQVYQAGYLLSRLGGNGALDTSFHWSEFDAGHGFATSIAVQEDGKAIVGGYFAAVTDIETGSTVTRNHLARFNDDGSLDQSFGAGQSLANDMVESVVVQPDGRILIAGSFTSVNGVPRQRIARLLGDAPVMQNQRRGGTDLVMSWPAAYTNFVLQSAASIPATNWSNVSVVPTVVNGLRYVTNETACNAKFFRLVKE